MPAQPPLSVLMVSPGFHPFFGGAERQALELSSALRARGVAVRVLTRRLPGLSAQEEPRGIPVQRLWCAGPGLLNALSFLASLTLWLFRNSRAYDAIHVHLAGSPAIAAALAGRLLRKRVIVKLGGGKGIGELAASARKPAGLLKLLALRLLRPQFTAVASELVGEARRHLGGVAVHVIPNGVDAKAFRPADHAARAAGRRQLGWPGGLGFLYVGRFSPEKRLPQFIETWAEEQKRAGADAFLALVGDGVEKPRMLAEIERARLPGRILARPPLDEIAAAYAGADVFVLPSLSEGLSNALLEAMSSGLAVLGSRVGGTAEAVVHGQAGLLFDPNSSDELRQELAKLLSHPELAARLGAAARETVLRSYTIEKIAERYELLYRFAA